MNQSFVENILFLDIETVPAVGNFEDLTPRLQTMWSTKVEKTKVECPIDTLTT